MEKISTVNQQNGENIYLQNAARTAQLVLEVQMPYKLRDMVVLVLARVTRCRIATAYRVVRWACIKLRIDAR